MSLEKRLDELDGGPPADLIDKGGRRFGAPDPGRAVDAPRDDLAAIAADRQADHSAGMSAQGEDVIAGLGIPELDGPVVAGRGEAAAVGKVGDGADQAGVSFEPANQDPLARVPDDDLGARRSAILSADRGKKAAIGRESHVLAMCKAWLSGCRHRWQG